jgi:DNA-binding PadR family transcriptional regulator
MKSSAARRAPVAPRTLWSLAVLGLLRERAMHPYEMQRELQRRHTDDLLALKRGSIYHSITQLQRADLIEPVETSREGRWPERTVYRITPAGTEELGTWLHDMLSTPIREPSHFTAALAHIVNLNPRDALEQLQMRQVGLEATIAGWRAVERGIGDLVGRRSILELEYARGQVEAELAWVQSIIADLQHGILNWDVDNINDHIDNTEHDD